MHSRSKVAVATALLVLLPAVSFSQTHSIIRPQLSAYEKRIPYLIPFRLLQHPRVALILSGGGARGISQIGVLKAFEKHNIPIDLIVGTRHEVGLTVDGQTNFKLEDGDRITCTASANLAKFLRFGPKNYFFPVLAEKMRWSVPTQLLRGDANPEA